MANRKDSKGRVLRTGESQRKDGIYMYRYTDINKKRVCVYAPTLKELREKEKEIQELINHGICYIENSLTLVQLIEYYKKLKQEVSYSTKVLYNRTIKLLNQTVLGSKKIKDVKSSDLRLWFIHLYKNGKGYNSIKALYAVIKAAYKIALTEDIVNKSPCNFTLSSVIEDNSTHRRSLTNEECKNILIYLKESPKHRRYLPIFIILLETGVRVGELCGLTLNDIDLENRIISISHQLIVEDKSRFTITTPKSKSGIRKIPMTESVYRSFKEVIEERKQLPKIKTNVDGYTDFIFLTKKGRPLYPRCLIMYFHDIIQAYNELHSDNPMVQITPHMLRHTFCSKLANNGMSIKNLQYLMGHANASVTLNTYTHTVYSVAAEEMLQKIG